MLLIIDLHCRLLLGLSYGYLKLNPTAGKKNTLDSSDMTMTAKSTELKRRRCILIFFHPKRSLYNTR